MIFPIVIKRPQLIEINKIKNLFHSTISNNFCLENINNKNEIENEVNQLIKMVELDIKTQGDSEYFLFAHYQNQIIGSIGYGTPNSIITNNTTIYSQIKEIKGVYILPEFQHKGIGTILFNYLIKEMKNKDIKEFCLDCGYSISQGFWIKKLGNPQFTLNNFWGVDKHHLIWHIKEL